MSRYSPAFSSKQATTLSRLLPKIGAAATRAAIVAELPANEPIGTLYQSSVGKLYQKVSNTPATQPPVQAAPSTATTGGTLTAGTYYYVITALNSGGETTQSNEVSQVTTGATSTITLSWASVAGATGYNIYRGTAAGLENAQFTVGAVTTYTDTGTAGTAASPPATNSFTAADWQRVTFTAVD